MAQVMVLSPALVRAFGAQTDSMELVTSRLREVFKGQRIISWEGDPETFAFSYVGGDAEQILGYSPRQWTDDSKFWTSKIVCDEDREYAEAFCALATGRGLDHEFEYRALHLDGGVVWLRDLVRVFLSKRNVPCLLRGVMVDITADKEERGETLPAEPRPQGLKPTG